MKTITIADYLLLRLHELGITDVFGVPGDYNLGFLDHIVQNKKLQWVGTANELNGAYAADGYARVRGAGALVTTFGVGELSAINGIAGAFAEFVPVVNIVGMPSLTSQADKALLHHSLGTGDFDVFMKMYTEVTEAHTMLTKENAVEEIDRVLTTAWIKKRPVYIGLPSDVVELEVSEPTEKLNLNYPLTNLDAMQECISRISEEIRHSKKPVILIDICAVRHPMRPLILKLLEQTGIPFASMNMGKCLIDESHPQFLGMYCGELSDAGVKERVEGADYILSFGSLLTDLNTGGFTTTLDASVSTEIHSDHVDVKRSIYENIFFGDSIPALTKALEGFHFDDTEHLQKNGHFEIKKQDVEQDRFWHFISAHLPKDPIIVAETGTSLFGTLAARLPGNVEFICQALWASIGYSVGAALGACVADPKRPTLLFVGDGSFQLTAQEISTIMRHDLTPIVFLINNDGYTIERVIHGPNMEYNDIKEWDYSELPAVFGTNAWARKVQTEPELENALQEALHEKTKLRFIEVKMARDDVPTILAKVAEGMAKQNQY